MRIRDMIINLIEEGFSAKSIPLMLKNEVGFKNEEILEALEPDKIKIPEGIGTTIELHIIQTIDNLRETIEFNNKIFKDISKHDIISSREHTMQQNVNLSNELYHLKNYVKQLENEKVDLQIKLEKVRNCDTRKNVYCYECEDNSCVNNIWYSLRKEK